MCVIFNLKPGFMIPQKELELAVHNNPHGYGIILKDNGMLELKKGFAEKGTDPEEVARILEDNKDIERWVHVRWATVGDISEANTQPFSIFHTNKRSLFFMHNGTIAGSTTSYYNRGQNVHVVNGDLDSDTKKFADQLTLILARLKGEAGPADISDGVVQTILEKFWSYQSGRAVILANDLEPYFFNKSHWKEIKTDTGSFIASNDDYFSYLKRGFEYDKREAERKARIETEKAKEAAARPVNPTSKEEVHQLTCPGFSKRYSVSEDIANILEDYDIYHPGGYLQLANLAESEITILCERLSGGVPWLFMQLTGFLKEETEKRIDIEEKYKALLAGDQKSTPASTSSVEETREAFASVA